MADDKKPRSLATQAASKVPKMVRTNMAATLKAKEEGKKVAYAYIQDGQDEIMRAMDIVPAWGESFSGVCAAKRDAEKYLQKAESDNFSRSLCTYATCNLGFDMLREELRGRAGPRRPLGGHGKTGHDHRQRAAALRPPYQMAPGNAALPAGCTCLCREYVLSSL